MITWPMILANISVPLLGFVDTAVIGHLSHPGYLAGTALGSLIVTVIFWLLGFLRMSTTGQVAQATNDPQRLAVILQGVVWALLLSSLILIFQQQIFSSVLFLVPQNDMSVALTSAEQYFAIRIWAAPITLVNLVLAGFYIGRGQTKFMLVGVLLTNFVNLVLDILFVPVLNLGVEGVAYASLIAESVLLIFYLKGMSKYRTGFISAINKFKFDMQLLTLNLSLFLRSFLLQLCLSFLTIYATRYGEVVVAANAIIMQFFLFISFSLDGIAFALESLVGKSVGLKQNKKVRLFIRTGLVLSSSFALFYTLIYLLFHQSIFDLLTGLDSIKQILNDHVFWILLFPLVSYISFIMDGIFVGLTWSHKMLKSMFIAAVSFFTVFYLALEYNNHGLWLAFCCFMLMRGMAQFWILNRGLKTKLI